MTIPGFALVLAAAFCHATWNFFLKRINGGLELVWLFSVVSVLLYLPIAAYFVITNGVSFGLRELVFIAGSAALHLGYFLFLQTGYRKGDLSLVYPTARATGPFLSASFAVMVLGEQMTLQIALGAIAVIVGVVCLTGGFRNGAKNLSASFGFGIGAGTLIGSYTVWDAYAVSTLLIPPLLLDYASSVGRSVVLAPIAARRMKLVKSCWQDHRAGVVAIAVLNPLAYILVLYALTFTPVVYVAPTREISVLLTVLMGSVLLGEGDLKRRMIWATFILAGVILLATG
ncbi:MAG: DMT family transporter [Anderseniella sp.]